MYHCTVVMHPYVYPFFRMTYLLVYAFLRSTSSWTRILYYTPDSNLSIQAGQGGVVCACL